MALHGNQSVLLKSPGRYLGTGQAGLRNNFNRGGCNHNFRYQDGETTTNKLYAVPNGYNGDNHAAWIMPQVAGAISSTNAAECAVTTTGLAYMGYPIDGSISIAITTNTPDGQLITSGAGSTTIAVTFNTPLLTASLNGTGTTSLAITTNTPTLGADAGLSGSSGLSCTGTLVPYAIGHMEGAALPYTELSPQSLAAAVWGQPIEGVYTAEEVMRIIAAVAAGDATSLEGATPEFAALDGSKTRIVSTYAGGTRNITALDVT